MKVGISFMPVNPRFWVDTAMAAEQAGFESVWLPEHLVLPVEMSGSPHTGHAEPPIPASMPAFDVWVGLGMIAARTSTLRLGTHVYNIGLRHPFVTARAITTLDKLSGGRVELGIGASWLREEWEATGLDFDSRGRRVNEIIEICKRLWTEEVIEHKGEFFEFKPVMFEPKPAQEGGPPIIVGGDSPAAIRRAARYGDGWIPMNHSVEQLPAGLAKIQELRAKEGRSGPFEVTMSGRISTPDDVERLAEAGIDRVLTTPFTSSREAIPGIEKFGKEILSKL